MRNFDFDPYETLGLNHNATQSEIRKAYQKLALKYHPDRRHNQSQNKNNNNNNENNGEDDIPYGSGIVNYSTTQEEEKNEVKAAENKMARINEAYSILKDEGQKKQFDSYYRCGGLEMVQKSRYREGNGESRTTSTQQFRPPRHMRPTYARPSSFSNDPAYASRNMNGTTGQWNPREGGGGGGTSFTFTSTSNEHKRETGEKISKRTTTSFRNGTKYVNVETFTVRRDGTSERRFTSHSEENATVMGHFAKSMFGLKNKKKNSSINARNARAASNGMNNSQRSMESKNAPWFENICSQIKKCVG